jgi:uncharacterized membrane protein HdeD (DUF308 family)
MANDAARALSEPGGAVLPHNWRWLVLRGVLAALLGIAALLFPLSALFAFTMVFAAFAFVDGILSIVSGIRGARRKEERWWSLVLRGLVGLLVGILFVLMPVVTTISYALVTLVLLAAWSILVGLFEVLAAVRLRRAIRGEWLLGLSGLLSILLGLAIPVVLLTYPGATILSVGWLIGVYALAVGVVLVIQGFRLRSRSPQQATASATSAGRGVSSALP